MKKIKTRNRVFYVIDNTNKMQRQKNIVQKAIAFIRKKIHNFFHPSPEDRSRIFGFSRQTITPEELEELAELIEELRKSGEHEDMIRSLTRQNRHINSRKQESDRPQIRLLHRQTQGGKSVRPTAASKKKQRMIRRLK